MNARRGNIGSLERSYANMDRLTNKKDSVIESRIHQGNKLVQIQ